MIVAELNGVRPPGAAPYYSLVVRDQYTVGRLDSSDIVLDHRHAAGGQVPHKLRVVGPVG